MKATRIVLVATALLITSVAIFWADVPVFEHRISTDRVIAPRVLETLRRARPDLAIESATFSGTRPDFEVSVVVKNRGLVNYEPDQCANYRAMLSLWHGHGEHLIKLADSVPIPALRRGQEETLSLRIQMPNEGSAEAVIQWDADVRNDRARLIWIF